MGVLHDRISRLIPLGFYIIHICLTSRCASTCWGSWSEYGECTDHCGTHGYQTSTRQVSPPPDCVSWVAQYGCPGNSSRTRACNRMCYNGGTPHDGWCSCTAWYQGTCCETREILFSLAMSHYYLQNATYYAIPKIYLPHSVVDGTSVYGHSVRTHASKD